MAPESAGLLALPQKTFTSECQPNLPQEPLPMADYDWFMDIT
jgi:hypothetical protein